MLTKLFSIFFISVIAITASAQCTLKISYNYTGTYTPKISDFHLYINGDEAVFIRQNEKVVVTTEEGYRITVPERDDRRYFNTNSLQIIDVDLTKKKNNITESTAKAYDWHITNETKEVLGYKVIKATAVSKNPYVGGYVVAWFAPDLPCTAGPVELWGLPGVILEYYYEESSGVLYFATEVSLLDEAPNIKELAQLDETKTSRRKHKKSKRKVDGKMRNVFSQ